MQPSYVAYRSGELGRGAPDLICDDRKTGVTYRINRRVKKLPTKIVCCLFLTTK